MLEQGVATRQAYIAVAALELALLLLLSRCPSTATTATITSIATTATTEDDGVRKGQCPHVALQSVGVFPIHPADPAHVQTCHATRHATRHTTCSGLRPHLHLRLHRCPFEYAPFSDVDELHRLVHAHVDVARRAPVLVPVPTEPVLAAESPPAKPAVRRPLGPRTARLQPGHPGAQRALPPDGGRVRRPVRDEQRDQTEAPRVVVRVPALRLIPTEGQVYVPRRGQHGRCGRQVVGHEHGVALGMRSRVLQVAQPEVRVVEEHVVLRAQLRPPRPEGRRVDAVPDDRAARPELVQAGARVRVRAPQLILVDEGRGRQDHSRGAERPRQGHAVGQVAIPHRQHAERSAPRRQQSAVHVGGVRLVHRAMPE